MVNRKILSNRFITLILIVVFSCSFITGLLPYYIDDIEYGVSLDENGNPIDDFVVNDEEVWYSGETVKTNIIFNKQTFDPQDVLVYWQHKDNLDLELMRYIGSIYTNDNSNFTYQLSFDTGLASTYVLFEWQMYCGGSGILYYNDVNTKIQSSTAEIEYSGGNSGTFVINNSVLNAQGYISGYVQFAGSTTSVYTSVYAQTTNGYQQILYDIQTGISITDVQEMTLLMDMFYFLRNPIINYIDSQYKYSSDSIILHKLSIPSIRLSNYIEVFTPLDWEYSSCTPTSTISFSGTTKNFKILNPTELEYTIKFYTTNTNYQAIVDITDSLLVDPSFERFTLDDNTSSTNSADSFDLVTNITSHGDVALMITEADIATVDFNMDIEYNGELTGYFDYYLDDGTDITGVRLYRYSEKTGWSYDEWTAADDKRDDRYHRQFFNFTVLGTDSSTSRNVYIEFLGVNGIIFLDNIHFFEVSITIKTIDIDMYGISVLFVTFDGYQNPSVTYKTATIQIMDRSSGDLVSIQNVSILLDGIAYHEFYIAFEMKEYFIYAFIVGSSVLLFKSSDPINDGNLIIDYAAKPILEGYTVANSGGSATTSLVINKPSEVAEGHVMIIFFGSDEAGTTDDLSVSGWNEIREIGGSSMDARMAAYWKVATGSEPSTYTCSSADSNELIAWCFTFSSCDPTNPIHDSEERYGYSAAFYTMDAGDASEIYTYQIGACAWDGGDVGPFAVSGTGWTEHSEVSSGSGPNDCEGVSMTNVISAIQAIPDCTVTSSDGTEGISAIFLVLAGTVPDVTDPILSAPSDETYEFGSTSGESISWTVTEINPNDYIVYKNGSNVEGSTYSNGVPIVYDLAVDLEIGIYNYTIWVDDDSSNAAIDTVWITVEDTTSPTIDSPADDQYNEGSTSNEIEWVDPEDYFPNDYTVYCNDTGWDSGQWEGGSGTIVVDIDGLSIGIYNFTIDIDDDYGNNVTDIVWITVVDATNPSSDSPADDTIEYNSSIDDVTWTVTDVNPDKYEIWKNGTIDQSGSYTSGVGIVYELDGLALGIYNLTIFVNDTTSNFDIDTVWVTVEDTTNPVIDSPSDDSYYEDDTGNSITWTITELLVDGYIVYYNGSELDSGAYVNDVGEVIDIDGLSYGIWNLTIIAYDTSGNFVIDTVWITVGDDTGPSIDSPVDDEFVEGSSGNDITWTVTELNEGYYIVYYNDSVLESDTYSTGVGIVVDIDSLTIGIWNLTIWANDSEGNFDTDIVWITVTEAIDDVSPDLDSPSDQDVELGSTSNEIVWTVGDEDPGDYEIWYEDSIVEEGSWTNGTIDADSGECDGLGVGVYNFTIYVNDSSGNFAVDTVWFTVEDTTDPNTDSPADDTIELGSTSDDITWTATDLDDDVYSIWKNESIQVTDGSWTTSVPIVYELDGFGLGVWNITIKVEDVSGNFVIDIVWITVEDTTNPGTDSPVDDTIELGGTSDDITWTCTDEDAHEYEVWYNGTNWDDGSWTTSVPLVVELDGLTLGIWNMTIRFNDTSGNFVTDIVWITVEDTTNPNTDSPRRYYKS